MSLTPDQQRAQRVATAVAIVKKLASLGDGEALAIALVSYLFRDLSQASKRRVLQYAWARFCDEGEDSMTITDSDLVRLEELASKATPGPLTVPQAAEAIRVAHEALDAHVQTCRVCSDEYEETIDPLACEQFSKLFCTVVALQEERLGVDALGEGDL